MIDADELHRCYRAARCADAERMTDGRRLGRAINAAAGLCDTCTRHVQRALDSLPRDYAELECLLGRGFVAATVDEAVAGSPELPIPLRLPVEALQSEIDHCTAVWVEPVAELVRVDWCTAAMRRARRGYRVQRAARLLAARLPVLLALRDVWHLPARDEPPTTGDGIDAALALLDAHRRARWLTGQTRLVHRLTVPCPRCERPALTRADGGDTVHCQACARAYSLDEYEALCDALADRRVMV